MEIGYILTAVFALIWVGFKVYETIQKNKVKTTEEKKDVVEYERY